MSDSVREELEAGAALAASALKCVLLDKDAKNVVAAAKELLDRAGYVSKTVPAQTNVQINIAQAVEGLKELRNATKSQEIPLQTSEANPATAIHVEGHATAATDADATGEASK
jgi:uncharacterized protein YqgV (UPF0045/DUF77 family)